MEVVETSALETFLQAAAVLVPSDNDDAAAWTARLDTLEMDVRQQCMERLVSSGVAQEEEDLFQFWYQTLYRIYSIVQRIEQAASSSDAPTRKLPLPEAFSSLSEEDHFIDTSSEPPFPKTSAFWSMTQESFRRLTASLSLLRKIPVLLLDDITELLPLEAAYRFWRRGILQQPPWDVTLPPIRNESSFSSQRLFFSSVLWDPARTTSSSTAAATPNPGWLPFLKTANKFIRRLQVLGPLAIASLEVPVNSSTTSVVITASMAISEIVLLLSTIYPLTEKSATRVWGSFNEQHVTEMESELEFANDYAVSPVSEETTKTTLLRSANAAVVSTPPDFSFYQDFWMIQQDFRNPNGIIVSDFLRRLKLVLRTLENNASRRRTLRKHGATFSLDDEQSLLLPFLTQSRILPIQLQDESIRSILLTQICIVIHHLMIQVPQLRSQLQSHLSTINDNLSTNHPTLPRISYILEQSESYWRQWKQNKCMPDLEKQRKSHSTVVERSRKRPRVLRNTNRNDDWLMSDLPNVSKRMRAENVPVIQEYLQDYVDALDPDAGIEAEYHPKNDSVFTWQALRLFAFGSAEEDDHLSEFHRILPHGDFENMVRHIYETDQKISIPGEGLPLYEYISDEEDVVDPEKNEEETILVGATDVPMDDNLDEKQNDGVGVQEKLQNGSNDKEIANGSVDDILMSEQNSSNDVEKEKDSAETLEPSSTVLENSDKKGALDIAKSTSTSSVKDVKKGAEDSKPRSSQTLPESDNTRNGNRGAVSLRSQDRNRSSSQNSRDVGGVDRSHDKYWSREGPGYSGMDGPASRGRAEPSSRDAMHSRSRDDMHRGRDDYHRRAGVDDPRRDDGEWRNSSGGGPDYQHGRNGSNNDRGRDTNRGGSNVRSRSGGTGWRSNDGGSSRR